MKNCLGRFAILCSLMIFLVGLGPLGDLQAASDGRTDGRTDGGTGRIGKVVLLRGDVLQVFEQKQKHLKNGDAVEEGGIVKTGPTGAVKLFLQDQTVLSLGPSSTLNLDEVKNRKIPNIRLVEGQIRAKVLKNIIASAISTHQVKFIVRTKTAAMGVRGTDFEVIYNPANNVTSLVTFEGAVAMIKVDPSLSESSNATANLASLLLSDQAVVVTEGRFSSANPALPQVTLPVKISPAQFESLKRNDVVSHGPSENITGEGHAGAAGVANTPGTPSKSFISPIPPGVDPKSFSSTSSSLDKVSPSVAVNGFSVAPAPPPEGQYNAKTGSYAPPAGGFLDLKSGLYIPPPVGSSYDANTGVYNPPAAMGKFDAVSGNYVPPQNFQLDAKQGLIPLPSSSSGGSSLASGQGNGARSPAATIGQPAGGLLAGGQLAGGQSPGVSPPRVPGVGGAGPVIVPGFSALNGGQGAPNGGGSNTLIGSAGGMPGVSIPGMVGGALPGMNLPGMSGQNNSGSTYSGYGAAITSALPLPLPLPVPGTPVTTTTGGGVAPYIPSGADPACPFCAPPATPPWIPLPGSTKVGFSFTVE